MSNQHRNSLIQSSINGNRLAQMQLYDNYCEAMFAVALRYLKNDDEAKDALQEGFLKAFLNLKYYEPRFTFGVWLKKIIINQCLDTLKKKHLIFESISQESFELVDEDIEFNTKINRQKVITAIDSLTQKYSIVLKLYIIEGYDHQEISELLKIPIKTSRTHLHRGKEKLKILLKPYLI